MPPAISLKSLIRLQHRQFTRGKKEGWVGKILLLIYFWAMEVLVFILLKDKFDFPPMIVAIACLGVLLPDFLLKLIFVHDRTVMDAFLKTRPIPQDQWMRFQLLSQFWNELNLVMPLLMAPACFLFLPFPHSLVILVALYLFSVLGGILVMLLKRRGPYQTEKSVSTLAVHAVKPDTIPPVFGLQVKILLRSKRLRSSVIWLSLLFLLEYVLQGLAQASYHQADFYLFGFFFLVSLTVPQYGLGVEAGFFSGLWTRPISVGRILLDKYRFSALLSGVAYFISLPLCLWVGTPWYLPLSYALFVSGAGALIMLYDAYKCIPFDLFGKTFFNQQGTTGTFRVSILIGFLLMGLGIGLPYLVPVRTASLIFGGLGLAGFAVHRPYFRMVERKFLNNKYKYLERYLSI